MSRYDDLRRMREAKFAATNTATEKPSVETLRTLIPDATKVPAIPATKSPITVEDRRNESATKTPPQQNATPDQSRAQAKLGRPLLGDNL
jgi:hypothetical protein